MKKLLVFDMDGTIADLYNVPNWLEDLESYNPRPYKIAKPMYDMDYLRCLLELLKEKKEYEIAITTWLSRDTTEKYDLEVTQVKKEWVDSYKFPYDYFYAVPYGTPKHKVTSATEQHIIIDDNEEVRLQWDGISIDATKNIIPILEKLLEKGEI